LGEIRWVSFQSPARFRVGLAHTALGFRLVGGRWKLTELLLPSGGAEP
jgi:hypothetical protein